MKRIPILLLPVLLLALLAACQTGPAEGDSAAPLPGAARITCRVVAIQDGQAILAQAEGRASDVYALPLEGIPVTYADPEQTALRPGDLVQVGYGGTIQETFPARLGEVAAIQVQAQGFDDLCTLYLQVLTDLWDTDTALNEGIVQLGLDLSQTRLSPAEQGAVGAALGRQRDLPVRQATWEELTQDGTIDAENAQWEDGLFLSIQEKDPAAADLTFTAQKWRGGLAAYSFVDCTARQGADGAWSSYTPGAHAIS